ncbi:ATP-dependent RNA helicase-like protein dbp8 [Venturia nashicola]|uniref:ATP-dependent RNA helicase-like protein dbp8 n=1 Tax=Venturia nashicola TaxID=86259 RepID=A0A4Z1PP29_9PEZI|nr:ATP-dependent RNA helicase-like protein dbp8 [Venturia nashicola]TLD36903.1 ATP-dependent RNA helicase-like protein dbp8 [Venturia nashicola]
MSSAETSSDSAVASITDVSSDESGSDVDFPEETPRKRRRISLSTEKSKSKEAQPIAPSLSRFKPKKQALPLRKVKEVEQVKSTASEDSVSTTTVKLEKTDFANINVHPWLVKSLANMAIIKPTKIQARCIPEILKGRDCIGGSRTGSGKTVAFAVPILQKWAEDPVGIFAVVLTPTRELALQIFEQFKAISSPQSLKPVLITGGADMREQALTLSQRPHIVIATPGRLADHIKNSGEDTVCGLRRVKYVVLDEADRLLAPGNGSMLPDLGTCLSVLPPSAERQTLLFTATVTPEVRSLKDEPRAPGRQSVFVCEVDTEDIAVPATLSQKYLLVSATQREPFLHELLQTPKNLEKTVIIFTNTKETATYVEYLLRKLGHRVTALHSALPQATRTSNLARFRASAARILIATDVAARGLDIPSVEIVINYDVPRDPDDYIHRVGRTARGGRKGEGITFIGQRDAQLIEAIEQRTGSKMDEFEEEGVNLETRVVREGLKIVSEAKREVLVQIEEGRDVVGKRKKGMQSRKQKK